MEIIIYIFIIAYNATYKDKSITSISYSFPDTSFTLLMSINLAPKIPLLIFN